MPETDHFSSFLNTLGSFSGVFYPNVDMEVNILIIFNFYVKFLTYKAKFYRLALMEFSPGLSKHPGGLKTGIFEHQIGLQPSGYAREKLLFL